MLRRPINRHAILPALVLMLSAHLAAQPVCSTTAPDSIFFDHVTYNQYLPSSFSIDAFIVNTGTTRIDSLVAFARSNQRFTVLPPATAFLADSLLPGDTVRTSFTLIVNPRSTSGIDTVTIAVSGKSGARTECSALIWVEKEFRPRNAIVCPPDSSLHVAFSDSLNDYVPAPLQVPVGVVNVGDAPSKETRILYVATPGVALADGQDAVLDVGTIAPNGGTADGTFRLRIVRRTMDTTVMLQFRVQGKGGIGDRIIDTICATPLHIPAARDVRFALTCANGITITYTNDTYAPDPFTWNVRIRHTGDATARDVRAVISVPAHIDLDSTSPGERFIGTMSPGEERDVQWTLRVKGTDHADTGLVCIRVFDAFNRSAACCDTVIVPARRAPALDIACTVMPDTIAVDAGTGQYRPAVFTVQITAGNSGTDTADSVQAELAVSDPSIDLIQPSASVQVLAASLAPGKAAEATWTLAPRVSSVARTVTIAFRVRSSNLQDRITTCSVYIAAALSPILTCDARTTPDDTLHFNRTSLEYDPLRFTATVRNAGLITARDVHAAILLPPSIALPDGETATVDIASLEASPDSSVTVSWQLQPLKRRDGVLDTIRVEFRSGAVRTQCEDWIFMIGIPPITVLSIPVNAVERYGRDLNVPIEIDNTDNKNVTALDVVVRYDPDKIALTALEPDSLMLKGWMFSDMSYPGTVSFHAQCDTGGLRGEGALAHMHFNVLFGQGGDILKIAGVPLAFDTTQSAVNSGSIVARYLDGFVTVSGDCLWPLNASSNYIVLQTAPDPATGQAFIRYTIPASAHVQLEVFDMLGRRTAVLEDAERSPGSHTVAFDSQMLRPGSYVLRLTAGEKTAIKKLRVGGK